MELRGVRVGGGGIGTTKSSIVQLQIRKHIMLFGSFCLHRGLLLSLRGDMCAFVPVLRLLQILRPPDGALGQVGGPLRRLLGSRRASYHTRLSCAPC